MCRPFLHVGGEQRVQQIIHVVLLLQGCLPAHPDAVTLGGLPGIRYNNFRKLKSKQKKTWFAALW